jgi:hypothetical protein
MLKDRLYCFRGRNRGLEGRRVWAPIGEPFLIMLPDMLGNGCFGLGGPMIEAEGLLAD